MPVRAQATVDLKPFHASDRTALENLWPNLPKTPYVTRLFPAPNRSLDVPAVHGAVEITLSQYADESLRYQALNGLSTAVHLYEYIELLVALKEANLQANWPTFRALVTCEVKAEELPGVDNPHNTEIIPKLEPGEYIVGVLMTVVKNTKPLNDAALRDSQSYILKAAIEKDLTEQATELGYAWSPLFNDFCYYVDKEGRAVPFIVTLSLTGTANDIQRLGDSFKGPLDTNAIKKVLEAVGERPPPGPCVRKDKTSV